MGTHLASAHVLSSLRGWVALELPLLLGIGVALCAAAVGAFALRQWLRMRAMEELAERLGLSYDPVDESIPARYAFLHATGRGKGREGRNVLAGTIDGHPVRVFDYPGAGFLGRTLLVLEHLGDFPELRIYPERLASKIAQEAGLEDIELESLEFSRAFCVRSQDRKLAYDVCNARMMDYLLRHGDLAVELRRFCLVLSLGRLVRDIPARLQQLAELRNLMPAYLFRNQAEG